MWCISEETKEFARLLASDRDAAGSDLWSQMLDITNKWAAVDTGAIENLYDVDRGFTYTVAATTVAWARIPQEKGEDVVRVIADQLAGYEHVLDAATANVEISEYWIRGLHEVLCRSQNTSRVLTSIGWQERPLVKGAYKTDPNNPLNLASNHVHSYAPPLDVTPEMARFVGELRSPEFIAAHPVVQAAYVHYAFVCIHPFADGTGRVSRALASVHLYRAYGVPIVIFADQKGRYLDCLEAADAGRGSQFTVFFRDCVIDTVNLIRTQLESAQSPELEKEMAQFSTLLTGREGLQHETLDEAAARLDALMVDTPHESAAEFPGQNLFTLQVTRAYTPPEPPPGYRSVTQRSPQMELSSAAPAAGRGIRIFTTFVAKADTDGADLLVVEGASRTVLQAFLRDVYPVVSEALRLRVRSLVETTVRTLAREVRTQAEESLRASGYRS